MSRGKLRSVKARIQSTSALMKITRAMEMVARARVRKLEEGFRKAKTFASSVEVLKDRIDFPRVIIRLLLEAESLFLLL